MGPAKPPAPAPAPQPVFICRSYLKCQCQMYLFLLLFVVQIPTFGEGGSVSDSGLEPPKLPWAWSWHEPGEAGNGAVPFSFFGAGGLGLGDFRVLRDFKEVLCVPGCLCSCPCPKLEAVTSPSPARTWWEHLENVINYPKCSSLARTKWFFFPYPLFFNAQQSHWCGVLYEEITYFWRK